RASAAVKPAAIRGPRQGRASTSVSQNEPPRAGRRLELHKPFTGRPAPQAMVGLTKCQRVDFVEAGWPNLLERAGCALDPVEIPFFGAVVATGGVYPAAARIGGNRFDIGA